MTLQLAFIAACVILAGLGIPRDRFLWVILALSSVVHVTLETYVWPVASWVMPCVGAIEFLTAAIIARCAWTKTGKAITAILCFLSLWHCWFYIDFETGRFLIYDIYSEVITLATLIMLTFGFHGLIHALRAIPSRLAQCLPNRSAGVRVGKPSLPKTHPSQ